MIKIDLCKRLFRAIMRQIMEPNTPNNPPTKPSFWASLWEWVKVIAIALIISLPIRFFIAEPFVVNGASMDPTFATGQFLIVDRLSYRFESPKRGDVIVFRYPNQPSTYYIKRIIGLPGETVSIKNGHISISTKNSTTTVAIDEPYINSSHRSFDGLLVYRLSSLLVKDPKL
jgi:signal peptidase I